MASSPTRADKASVNQSFHALMRLLRYAKGYRRQIITATMCSIINKLFDIAPEILIGVAIDVVVNQESSFVARLGLNLPRSRSPFWRCSLSLFGRGRCSSTCFQILWRNLAQRLQADMRQDTYEHAQRLDMAFSNRKAPASWWPP